MRDVSVRDQNKNTMMHTARSSLASAASTIGPIFAKSEIRCEKRKHSDEPPFSKPRSKLIFLGTGSSTGCPRPLCPMVFKSGNRLPETPQIQKMKEQLAPVCVTSNLAMDGDPRRNKNYRNNPSLLIANYDGSVPQHIVIDVGKTFREAALRWFPGNGINSLDAVILTHEHADAAFGLDDLRGFQRWEGKFDHNTGQRPKAIPMPVYLSQDCFNDVSVRFPWLFPAYQKAPTTKSNKPLVQRHVSSLDVNVFEPLVPFDIDGFKVVPLPVMHGEDLVSFGYAFTVGQTNVVYLSDISRMLPETLEYIQNKLPSTDILIIDALLVNRPNPVHFNLREALEVVRQVRPKQTYLVGMNCDSFRPHDEMNESLRKEHGNVQLAHDGLVIEC